MPAVAPAPTLHPPASPPQGDLVYDPSSENEVDPLAWPRLFDLRGEDLPSGGTAKVDGMRGKQQREFQLAVQRKETQGEALQKILLGCTKLLNGHPPTETELADLHAADARALMLRIRGLTWPSSTIVAMPWTCAPPHISSGGCGHVNDESGVDMANITWTPAYVPPVVAARLPVDGRPFTYGIPTHRSEVSYMKLRRGAKEMDFDHLILSRGVMVDGHRLNQVGLDNMLGEDRDAIVTALLEQGGPDTKTAAVCGNCGAIWKSRLEALAGFLFPTVKR